MTAIAIILSKAGRSIFAKKPCIHAYFLVLNNTANSYYHYAPKQQPTSTNNQSNKNCSEILIPVSIESKAYSL